MPTRLTRAASGGKSTIVPNYVTESGFTEDIPGRTKVGAPMSTQELYLYDMQKDTVYVLKTDSIPGIKDLPDYVKRLSGCVRRERPRILPCAPSLIPTPPGRPSMLMQW